MDLSPTLEWLLEADANHPGVRYLALRHLVGLAADDPQLIAACQQTVKSGPAADILTHQQPDGGWDAPGEAAYNKYRGSHWQLHILACLGADPRDERIRKAGQHALQAFINPSGAFSYNRPPTPSGAILCLNGNLVDALIQLGFAGDERLQAAAGWIARAITGEDPIQYFKSGTVGPGFACAANLEQPCGWGAVKTLRALTSLPEELKTPLIRRALAVGAEFLLSRNPAKADYPYTERVSSTWFKLGFPLSYWADILELVDVLARLGYGQDPRLDGAWELIMSKGDSQGRWPLENSLNGKMWADVDQKGQPSKWVTLRVLQAMRRAGRLEGVV